MSTTPIKARAFPCPYCPRVYALSRHLNRHVDIHDPKTKRFACSWDGCDHTTRQRSNLKTHMKKHTNTKDIFCTKCAYATGDPALALRHQKRAHGYKPRTIRKRRYTISEASSSSSGSEASFPTTPTSEAKPELDIWQLEYPFDDAFTNVQAKPLYPAAEALPALSFDVESLFSMDTGYDWSSPTTNAESPVSSPDIWSSWATTPSHTFSVESTPSSFNWSDYSVAQPITTPSPEASPFPYLPSPSPSSDTPYLEQSLEQFFSLALPDAFASSDGAPPIQPVYGNDGSYFPGQLSGSQHCADNNFFNGLY